MNQQQLDTLRDELQQPDYAAFVAAQDYPAIAAMLNERPQVENPESQQQTPKRLTLTQVFGAAVAIDPAGVLNAVEKFGPLLSMAEAAVNLNDRPAMLVHMQIFGSQMSQEAQQALGALLSETEPDPNWQETVSGQSRAEALGLLSTGSSTVTSADVQGVLNAVAG